MAKADTKTKYVAYTDLGPNGGPGSFVDPEAFGGEGSDNFQYMLDHRSVVPLGDPDAALAMGSSGAVAAADEAEAAREAELEALRARVKELEAAADTKAEAPSAPRPVAPAAGATSGPSSQTTTTKK